MQSVYTFDRGDQIKDLISISVSFRYHCIAQMEHIRSKVDLTIRQIHSFWINGWQNIQKLKPHKSAVLDGNVNLHTTSRVESGICNDTDGGMRFMNRRRSHCLIQSKSASISSLGTLSCSVGKANGTYSHTMVLPSRTLDGDCTMTMDSRI